jgi:hypothetical protein
VGDARASRSEAATSRFNDLTFQSFNNLTRRSHQPRKLSGSSAAFHLKSDFGVDPISSDLLVFHCGSEFFDIDRADVAQRFGSFTDDALHGVFPALGRFGQQFDNFDDFGHE